MNSLQIYFNPEGNFFGDVKISIAKTLRSKLMKVSLDKI